MNTLLKKGCALMALTILPAGAFLGTAFAEDAVTTQSSSQFFTDIDYSFARSDIETFVTRGLTVGYRDGTFRPNSSITRAEFLALTMRSLSISVDGSMTSTLFEDVSSGDGLWIVPYVEKARQMGIVYGQIIDGSLRFRPNDAITRAEALIVLFRAANISIDANLNTTVYEDISPYAGGVLIPYAERARQLNIMYGQTINGVLRFRPHDSITRAESVTIIIKTPSL